MNLSYLSLRRLCNAQRIVRLHVQHVLVDVSEGRIRHLGKLHGLVDA